MIDIFVYTLEVDSGDTEVAVTNGMSDQRMVDADDSNDWSRRKSIQYFPKCTEGHVRRLHDMAWLPLFNGFLLDACHSMAWEYPAVPGTPWKNAFFLTPLLIHFRSAQIWLERSVANILSTGNAGNLGHHDEDSVRCCPCWINGQAERQESIAANFKADACLRLRCI